MQSVTISEAARRMGVSTKTIRRRIADGSLAAHKAAGPGGFQYRVTDPSVLVVQAGQDNRLDRTAKPEPGVGQQVGAVLLELSSRIAAAEVRAARLEAERDRLLGELESLRRAFPAPPDGYSSDAHPGTPARRWWERWPFG